MKLEERIQAFIDKANNKFNNKYDYSLVYETYKNNESIITIKCPIHGNIETTSQRHLQSITGCTKCSNNAKSDNIESFIRKANLIHNNKYDYSLVKYKNNNIKVEIICPIHGKFEQLPSVHISQQSGCPRCFYNNLSDMHTLSQDEYITKAKQIHHNKYDYSKVNYVDDKHDIIVICPVHGEFNINPGYHTRNKIGCKKCSTTKAELEILDLVPKSIHNDRHFISPLEIDILSHEHKLAIEYDGILWHSFGKTFPNNIHLIDKKYHLNKTEAIEEKGYQLFHIFENEWNEKKEIWESMIKNKIGLSNKIYARKCKIEEISEKESRDFLRFNHIQSSKRIGKIRIGLLYENELVAIMTFGTTLNKSDYEYELIRFCNKLNTTVIGGASKLLKYFERNYRPKSIISYANRRWSQGNLYKKLGFKLTNISEPNFFYIDENMKIHSRISFQKHLLHNKLEYFDSNLSALQNMINNNYRIIYDCGNYTFVKIY